MVRPFCGCAAFSTAGLSPERTARKDGGGIFLLLPGEQLEAIGRGVFAIVSDRRRVQTDTVLLAAFAAPRDGETCADFGTGCGAIPLYWCARFHPGPVYAAELQPDACGMARRSAERNGLSDRIRVVPCDIRALKPGGPVPGGLDLIACNPPYWADGTGRQSARETERIARHETACSFADAASAASALLRRGGRFVCCQRPARLFEVLQTLQENGLTPKRLRLVQHRAGKAPFLFLLQANRGGKPGLVVEPVLLLYDEAGNRTKEVTEIYGAYGEEKE